MRIMCKKKKERMGILFFMMISAAFLMGFSHQVYAEETDPHDTQEIVETVDQNGETATNENEKTVDTDQQAQETLVAEQQISVNELTNQPPETTAQLTESKVNKPVEDHANVSYATHVQTFGWQPDKTNGQVSGTYGLAKRLEGITVRITGSQLSGNVEYRTHVQTYGWETTWKKNGQVSGTTGQSKRLEGIQIRLTNELANMYDIYYRVHSQTFGWLGWAKNGEYAGTQGYSKRLEAIEIRLVKKDSNSAPAQNKQAFIADNIKYCTHVQTYGWQSYVKDGALAGTTGKSKRVEGIKIYISNPALNCGVKYRTSVQSYGWMDWKHDGQMAGTSGEAKRLEAIQIELTGAGASQYDVYYRVHAETFGWMGWAKNGGNAGTEGYGKRLEAIEIQVVKKNSSAAPKINGTSYYKYNPTWTGMRIANAAKAQIGVYQDCTKLVTNAIKAVGVNFHGSPQQYFSVGNRVSTPMEGDIIVYNNHVAIYLNPSQAVHGGWNGTTAYAGVNVSGMTILGYVRVKPKY